MLKFYVTAALLLSVPGYLSAQTPNQYFPYSFPFLQKLDKVIYGPSTSFHSSIKPVFIDDSLLARAVDSIFSYGVDTSRHSFVYRKLFNEHIIDIKTPAYTFFADYLLDLQVGQESENMRKTWLNTRGFQLGGTVGAKFSFYTNLFENNAKFPGYINRIVNRDSIIPGQTIESHLLANEPIGTADWSYSSANVSYTPNKYVNLQLGYDKNFIGDGYRSMLLSDVSSNYPFLKTTFQLGQVKLMTIWAELIDPHANKLSYQNGYRKKWAVFHYLDWNVNHRLSIGFFESVIWQDADETGKRGFDFSYANPILLLRPVERQNGSPDNALTGLNVKYEATKQLSLYGQFILDELRSKEFFSSTGYWSNKWGLQLGLRGAEPFKIKNLRYLAEFNTARPYTFTEKEPINNYAHYNQPLAHPFGANFREVLVILNYDYRRFGFNLQVNKGLYGLDTPGKDYGKNVYTSYDYREHDYGNRIGQGLKTDFSYTESKISYMIKPRLNFRLEAGVVYRKETNNLSDNKTTWITFGLRTSFRNLYQDF